MDYLDVTVKVAFFAEYLIALRTSGWLVDLDVQMHLGEELKKDFRSCSINNKRSDPQIMEQNLQFLLQHYSL